MSVVKAQAKAAQTTIDFINTVGFQKDGSLVTVKFYYNLTNATTGKRQENSLEVPFLTIIPVPFLRVRFAFLRRYLQLAIHAFPQYRAIFKHSYHARSGLDLG